MYEDQLSDSAVRLKLWEPDNGDTFDRSDEDDDIEISWRTENVPPGSEILIELERIARTGASGAIGGGTHSRELQSGDATDEYSMQIHGEGRTSAGEYRLRAKVRECHSRGCRYNPDFPGQEEDVAVYAVSEWRYITIEDRDERVPEVNESGIRISRIRPNEGSVALGEPMTVTWNVWGVDEQPRDMCVIFQRQSDQKNFLPRGLGTEDPCRSAENGKHSFSWTPVSKPGFRFDPGEYRIVVRISNPPRDDAKDRGTAASLIGNWFTVTE